MVKLGRKMGFSLYPQRFFKVFLPHRSSHRLNFPSAFIKYLNYTTPFKATIVDPNNISWEVNVENINDNLYFNKGWEQFVTQNSLEFGHFLVFSYEGKKIFRVQIFGRNGCEKESTSPNKESCHIGDTEEIDDVAITGKLEDGESASKEATKFETNYPFFKLVMQPSYVVCGTVNIPASFIKEHMRHMTSDFKGITGITLVCADKSWPVNVSKFEKNCRVRKLSGGWRIFSRDNALKAGDVCVFELVDRTKYVLKVSIFRRSESI